MWLKQCHVYHLPVITIFIGGINHSQSWVVYGSVLTTLYLYIYIYPILLSHNISIYINLQYIYLQDIYLPQVYRFVIPMSGEHRYTTSRKIPRQQRTWHSALGAPFFVHGWGVAIVATMVQYNVALSESDESW